MVTEADNLYPVINQQKFRFVTGFYPLHPAGQDKTDTNTCFNMNDEQCLYLNAKSDCRSENIKKYYLINNSDDLLLQSNTITTIIEQLKRDWPDSVDIDQQHTQQTITLTTPCGSLSLFYDGTVYTIDDTGYVDALDALITQLQEDVAIVQVNSAGHDQVELLHICFPNHWSPASMLGKCFAGTHAKVPEMSHITQRSAQLYKSVFKHGPLCRDTWGLATDTRLNHHPVPPPTIDANNWAGRAFNPNNPQLFLRTEHQTLLPFADGEHIAFLIHTRHLDVSKMDKTRVTQLKQAIDTMPPAVRQYKGLTTSADAIMDWLDQLAATN